MAERPCARFVSGARYKGMLVDILWLVTQVQGRRYTVTLRAKQGQLAGDQMAAYAAMAALSFAAQDAADTACGAAEAKEPEDAEKPKNTGPEQKPATDSP